jgi:quinol-cytochrome oxidoreductase complex cytochrome b subunit
VSRLLGPRGPSLSPPEWAFVALVAVVLSVDTLLLVVPLSGAAVIRLALAVGALAAVPFSVALGVLRRPVYAVAGLLSLPVVAVYVTTGLLLPWNQLSYYTGQLALETLLSVPVVGEPLAVAFFGGLTLSAQSLRLAFGYHYATVALATVALLVVVAVTARRSRGEGEAGTAAG